jgi:hypothetical protein
MMRPEITHLPAEAATELQHSKEFLKIENPAVMRQTPLITGDLDVSWQIHHSRQFLTPG